MSRILVRSNALGHRLVENEWVLRGMPWLACGLGLLAQFRHMILSGFGRTHAGLGDARLVNFIL